MSRSLKELHDSKLLEDFMRRTIHSTVIFLILGLIACGMGVYFSEDSLFKQLPTILGALLVGINIEKLVSSRLLRLISNNKNNNI